MIPSVSTSHNIKGKVKKIIKKKNPVFEYVHWTVGLVKGFKEVSMNLSPLSLAH
jgi:galactitol-specific phosphotransferase system IIB component